MENYLKYKNYIGTVDFCAEDELFYGKVEGINDLLTFEGESVSDLKNAFIESVEDYLETCKEIGKEPEKTYKGSLNVRLNPELHKQASILASRKKVTLNELIKRSISYIISHENELDKLLTKGAQTNI